MSSRCIVRLAVVDDAAAVAALLRDAFDGYRPAAPHDLAGTPLFTMEKDHFAGS